MILDIFKCLHDLLVLVLVTLSHALLLLGPEGFLDPILNKLLIDDHLLFLLFDSGNSSSSSNTTTLSLSFLLGMRLFSDLLITFFTLSLFFRLIDSKTNLGGSWLLTLFLWGFSLAFLNFLL